MSWIVETLLRNRVKLRTKSDITSDEFLDLIVVESAVESLIEFGSLNEMDVKILNSVADGKSLRDAGKEVGITVGRRIGKICDLIAYKLGGVFTDEGYLDNLASKHNLDAGQVEVMRSHMRGKYKHTIVRNTEKHRRN